MRAPILFVVALAAVLVGCGAAPTALASAPTAPPDRPAVAIVAVGEGEIILDVVELI